MKKLLKKGFLSLFSCLLSWVHYILVWDWMTLLAHQESIKSLETECQSCGKRWNKGKLKYDMRFAKKVLKENKNSKDGFIYCNLCGQKTVQEVKIKKK